MSPFLFVLVMEVLQLMMQQLTDQNEGFSYQWRCKELGLFKLCFADDLLLLCKADVASIQVFRRGLDEFANLSGLHANPQKSQLIISRSAQEEREHLIAALQFQEGHLPLRYLGLPLLASRLSISDCYSLLLKVDSRIKGWDSIQLSFAGKLQLIKSVLMSLNVYWAMAFILPKGVIRKLRNGCDISCGKETRQWGIQRWHGVLCADRKRRGARNPGYPSTQQSSYVSPSLECDPWQPVIHLGAMDCS
ncbi:hypothetical protein Sango_3113700 [Sesamum angolense]|uniref:Reverse transcriptase domain-containing protein n=1 Tax=Sesamum angolense TaxID=2727404 RepID=A0AAE1W131_9LAMI|nr:hypothetical protein Sango_3113700 [Sesamum angolense]